jgi:hypothetical protein
MTFTILEEGMIARQPEQGPAAVAGCSRCVVTDAGELVCTFAVQEVLGKNDFKQVVVRSADGGKTWSAPAFIWPHWHNRCSLTGSISRTAGGELILFGIRIPVDAPGESFWSEATQGIKQNTLFRASSTDHGHTWTEPAAIPLPFPGSAEAPGALCVTRDGTWIGCYSPYNTFDPSVRVDRNRVVCIRSTDRGDTWTGGDMLRFDNPEATAAEAWVVELSDGRLLGTCWHIPPHGRPDCPNAYALSLDGGRTWTPTRSTGTHGQSTGLAALPGGRALFVYNQRKHGDPGVHLAVARPTPDDFGIELDEPVWRAATPTQSHASGDHENWRDYAFGEPSVTPLPDGTLLVTFWKIQPSERGIGYVKVALEE